ncbi:type VI secretion system baseplate subunit TssE [Marinobacterium stanieri]|uniref:type VI secretion system baseplate subunit TssE n=1 Tax=Marinobacterium stanieri TaxID=49186 RepID=UPI003A8F5848
MMSEDAFQAPFLQMLLDDNPDRAADDFSSPAIRYRTYKQSVMRDLENLLNNRCRHGDESVTSSGEMLLTYGVTDFAHINISALSGREALRQKILDTIRTNEPRLSDVQVELLERSAEQDRLGFRIDARLRIFTDAEPVVIQAAFEPSRNIFSFQPVQR